MYAVAPHFFNGTGFLQILVIQFRNDHCVKAIIDWFVFGYG